jgi:predicted amino acid dehydrogenase
VGERVKITGKTALGLAAGLGAAGVLLAKLTRSARAIDFAGKSVVIFGGSRGLGLVMARELAAEGARVVLASRDAEELERARADLDQRGLTVTTIPCDVRDRE